MQTGLPRISISDRVNAAQLNPSQTDTSKVPTEVNTSPGKSAPQPIDANPLNSAGANVNQQSQTANKGTSDSSRKGPIGEAGALQYENREVNPADQAPSPNRADDISKTPQPRSKGFKESLLDQKMSGMLKNNTGGDQSAQDRDLGHDNGDPNSSIKKAPEGKTLKRENIPNYRATPDVTDPGEYPNSIHTEGVMKKSASPNIKMPTSIKMPNIRLKF